MKSELIEAKPESQEETFPALYKGFSGVVVLVDKKPEGTTFSGFAVSGGSYGVGHNWREWITESFTRLPVGTKVILEQTA